MLCHIRQVLAILALLLALATAILWVRSYGKPFHYSRVTERPINTHRQLKRAIQFHSLDSGYVSIDYLSEILDYSKRDAELDRVRTIYPDILIYPYPWPSFGNRAGPPKETTAGFSCDYGSYKPNGPQLSKNERWIRVSFPHWFLILLLSIPGLIHFRHNLKHFLRLRRGLCPTCGYDLRESKSTCPECGTRHSTASSAP